MITADANLLLYAYVANGMPTKTRIACAWKDLDNKVEFTVAP